MKHERIALEYASHPATRMTWSRRLVRILLRVLIVIVLIPVLLIGLLLGIMLLTKLSPPTPLATEFQKDLGLALPAGAKQINASRGMVSIDPSMSAIWA
jgi:hypothetical protein